MSLKKDRRKSRNVVSEEVKKIGNEHEHNGYVEKKSFYKISGLTIFLGLCYYITTLGKDYWSKTGLEWIGIIFIVLIGAASMVYVIDG